MDFVLQILRKIIDLAIEYVLSSVYRNCIFVLSRFYILEDPERFFVYTVFADRRIRLNVNIAKRLDDLAIEMY